MLTKDLGYRPPSRLELASVFFRLAKDRLIGHPPPPGPPANISAAMLSAHPFISFSGQVPAAMLGLASHFPPGRNEQRWFLISPTWSMESEKVMKWVRRRGVAHRHRNPHDHLIYVCNTAEEVALLRARGEAAILINKASTVSEEAFRPLPDVPVTFDAVYNAQLVPWKRHELSLGIERCAFVFYRSTRNGGEAEIEAALMARHAGMPGHVFLNPIAADGAPVRLPPEAVNRHLNKAAVGLCLSATEGTMFASTEYLLAGLPVVTTPSRGGRDLYHDPEFCVTVPADPRAIAAAVTVLKARNIPRERIRAKTLERLERDRARFVDLVNAVLEESGAPQRFAMPWPFRKSPLLEWAPFETALQRAVAREVDGLATAPDEDVAAGGDRTS
jgi:hypothetical protein